MTTADQAAHPWFPPALPAALADPIRAQWWDTDRHWCAYLAWTAYAATLPPAQEVSSVATGTQSVSYSPAAPSGELGAALKRADWHRRQSGRGGLVSTPLAVSYRRLRWDSYDLRFRRGDDMK